MQYPVVVHKDLASDYGVSVPDVPGCFSAGETMEEALANAREALECHIEGMLMDDEAVPVPQGIETHRANPAYTDGLWALVYVDLSKMSLKARRVNITLPERLLNTVDRYAQHHGLTRSGLLAQAVAEYMTHHPSVA